jgi:hypothetical protein
MTSQASLVGFVGGTSGMVFGQTMSMCDRHGLVSFLIVAGEKKKICSECKKVQELYEEEKE